MLTLALTPQGLEAIRRESLKILYAGRLVQDPQSPLRLLLEGLERPDAVSGQKPCGAFVGDSRVVTAQENAGQ